MKITGFGKKIWKRLTTMGTKKSEHILFYKFYFQKKYNRNATKAIRNTQIGCLTVMIVVLLLIDSLIE